MVWKWLRERISGWTDDAYCQECGTQLEEWVVVDRYDPVYEGIILKQTRYKGCPSNRIQHRIWSRVERGGDRGF